MSSAVTSCCRSTKALAVEPATCQSGVTALASSSACGGANGLGAWPVACGGVVAGGGALGEAAGQRHGTVGGAGDCHACAAAGAGHERRQSFAPRGTAAQVAGEVHGRVPAARHRQRVDGQRLGRGAATDGDAADPVPAGGPNHLTGLHDAHAGQARAEPGATRPGGCRSAPPPRRRRRTGRWPCASRHRLLVNTATRLPGATA